MPDFKVAMIGVGMTAYGRHYTRSLEDLATEASLAAMDDAHVEHKDIDALIFGCTTANLMKYSGTPAQFISDHLGFSPKPAFRVENACPTGALAVHTAMGLILSGIHDIILVVAGDKEDQASPEILWRFGRLMYDTEYATHSGLTPPGASALYATRYMYEYGATVEDIAHVCAKNRSNGALNPKAFFQTPLTVEQVLTSPYAVYPLTLPELNPVVDGMAAAVICRADWAKKFVEEPVYVIGSGMGTGTCHSQDVRDWTEQEGVREAGQAAYKMAGVQPKDIDFAEVFDCMAPFEITSLEELGFFEKGTAYRAAPEGVTTLEGRFPVNVDGGNLSRGQSPSASTLVQAVEVATQLRGKADKRQVKCPNGLGLVEGHGGSNFQNVNVLIISR